jgi:hypothetical protein
MSLWIGWQKGEIITYFGRSLGGRLCRELIRCAFNSYMYYLLRVALCVYLYILSVFFFFFF